jgi:hypothetical protein
MFLTRYHVSLNYKFTYNYLVNIDQSDLTEEADINTTKRRFILVQILRFWTLSIVLSLSINTGAVYILKHDVSAAGICLRLQVKPTQLGPIDRDTDSLYRLDLTERVLPEDKDRIQSPKRRVLKHKQDGVFR